MSKANIAGATLISAGAALVGLMSGWEIGPCRFEISREWMAGFGAVTASLMGMAACHFAVERSEARARSRAAMQRLKWMLFRAKKPSGSDLYPVGPGKPGRETGDAVYTNGNSERFRSGGA